jgi:drug/metabolite transporter (DMT)-like permease
MPHAATPALPRRQCRPMNRTVASARKPHLDALAITLLLLCCAFWGFQQILIKFAVAEIPQLWQASLRFWGATLLLWLWCRLRGVPLFVRDGTLKAGLLAGLLFAGEFAAIYLGLMLTSASRLTVFLYTSPFVVALLLPRVVPGERLRRVQWIGLVMAFGAVALAFSEGFVHSSPVAGQWRGDALGLAAGILWGLTTLTIRATVLGEASAEKTLFYQVGVTAVVAPVLSLTLGETWGFDYSTLAWGSLALQTAVGAFVTYLTWMWMLRHYPATQMATFAFLTPVFALVFGVLLLGEALTLQLVLALVGVVAGIMLVNQRPRAGVGSAL